MADDYLTATHEAGHSCVASMFGYSVKCAILHPIGASQTEQGRCELRDHIGELDADPTRYLCYLLSGASAERRATGTYSARDASDLEQAVAAASAVLQAERESPRVKAAVLDAQRLANALMQDEALWRWVQRTAAALIRRRRLTGRDIAELREAV